MSSEGPDPGADGPTRALAASVGSGDRRALARMLTLVERGGPEAAHAAASLHGIGKGAATVGVTGAPGAGKSTLTAAIVTQLREGSARVAVLAVDPTSPYSGGAILGDRVRMQVHATDPDVFIRSMATRGHLGGLSVAAPRAVRVLDSAGFDWILVETVGVGQAEVEVAAHADTTVVVVNPGWGDGVQAAKAGLLEVADVFVVNKSDRPGGIETARDLEAMLDLAHREADAWRPPVIATVATTGEGVEQLIGVLVDHRAHLDSSGEGARRKRAQITEEIKQLVVERLSAAANERCRGVEFDELVDLVLKGEMDPWAAAVTIVPSA